MKKKVFRDFLNYLDNYAHTSKSVISLGVRLAFYMQIAAIIYYLYYFDNMTLFVVNNTQSVLRIAFTIFTISLIGGIFSDYMLRRNNI